MLIHLLLSLSILALRKDWKNGIQSTAKRVTRKWVPFMVGGVQKTSKAGGVLVMSLKRLNRKHTTQRRGRSLGAIWASHYWYKTLKDCRLLYKQLLHAPMDTEHDGWYRNPAEMAPLSIRAWIWNFLLDWYKDQAAHTLSCLPSPGVDKSRLEHCKMLLLKT